MMMRSALLLGSCAALAACGGSTSNLADSPTASGFGNVVNGEVVASLSDELNNSITTTAGTFAYVSGLNTNNGTAVARSGISSVSVGTVPEGAIPLDGTFTGVYAFTLIGNVSRTSEEISGLAAESGGIVNLTADFTNGTLTGAGASTAGGVSSEIIVDGVIGGRNSQGTFDLSGTVDVEYSDVLEPILPGSVTATLDGFAGTTGVIGVFHGNNSIATLAGGLSADRDTD